MSQTKVPCASCGTLEWYGHNPLRLCSSCIEKLPCTGCGGPRNKYVMDRSAGKLRLVSRCHECSKKEIRRYRHRLRLAGLSAALPSVRNAVYPILLEYGPCTIRELLPHLGMSYVYAVKALTALKSEGRATQSKPRSSLFKTSAGKGCIWTAIEEETPK